MLIIAGALGLGLAAFGETASHAAQREKEAELLFRGNQYRLAIESFHRAHQVYPPSLDDLVKDPRFPQPVRHLRKLYTDPMTGKEWGVLEAQGGGIMGVYSMSEGAPIKKHGFVPANRHFTEAKRYRDWQFFHNPLAPAPAPPQG